LGNFYKFKFFWAKFEIWGQFVIFKKFEGQICNFFEIYWDQIEIFEKFEDQNAKFEKL